jgi:hypothetical protein
MLGWSVMVVVINVGVYAGIASIPDNEIYKNTPHFA